MESDQVPSPDNKLADNDPGDETANRYRYQWTWAAIMCCSLLDETTGIQEVFCEHHEDILLRHEDGQYIGQQIKTRGNDQALWKAKDEAIISSCARFAKLERDFPGQFKNFRFLTNHPLQCSGNGQDFSFILESIKDTESFSDLSKAASSWIKRVAKEASVSDELIYQSMQKTRVRADLPKITDMTTRLISTIAQCWAPAKESSFSSVQKAALSLIEECGRASSLYHEQTIPIYLHGLNEEKEEVVQAIQGKCVTKSRVDDLLEEGRNGSASLSGDPALFKRPGEGSTDLLHKKLDAGGFSAVTRNSAEDLRNKADYLGIAWTKKYGNDEGLKRYNHIRSIVLSDAGRSFDATNEPADNFGPSMRDNLYNRFQYRRSIGSELYEATDDHLEGIAFSLTAQCEIAWSLARPWEDDQ